MAFDQCARRAHESAERRLIGRHAHYYDVVVDGEVNKDVAWYYPEPKSAASHIKDRVAFWCGVTVDE
jgi:uncharacterized protein (DUF427 family)